MTKHIELFPGSIQDLERLTGRLYESMKDEDGRLIKVAVGREKIEKNWRNPYPSSTDVADQELTSEAERHGANALVHVTYPVESFCGGIVIPAFGYAVKLKKRTCRVNPVD